MKYNFFWEAITNPLVLVRSPHTLQLSQLAVIDCSHFCSFQVTVILMKVETLSAIVTIRFLNSKYT